ncbi:MAG: phosphoribosylanthranilate isomerase [Oscillospiraceae bacterium]|jgi:phosphoribosylanthranilate isomerase|nr:phosphoribosylanthranilate isomerase [Oscillospiraceae bacterium]
MIKLKICGLRRAADVDYVNEAKADYAGFVFAEESRRFINPAQAALLRARLAKGIAPVGVFVNAPAESIVSLYQSGVIAIAQLHGEEDEAYIAALKEQCDIPVIQVFRMRATTEITPTRADYILLDSGSGSGQPFDWSRINRSAVPEKPWFLAGGIGLSNIEKALALAPYAIDVSSGAERNGWKDRAAIIELAKKVRNLG